MKKHVYYLALMVLMGNNCFAYLDDGDTSEEEEAVSRELVISSKMTFVTLKRGCEDIVSAPLATYLDALEIRTAYWRNVLLDIRINPEKYEEPQNIVQAIERGAIFR